MSGGYVTGATPMIRAILLALLTALLACSAPSEAPRVAEVLRLTVRFQAGMQADHRVRAREAIATAWMGTGAVVLVEGAPWESVPTPTAGPCTPEVHVGWLDPSSPDAPSDPKKIGIGYDRCTVRAALLVRGRARDDQIERAFAHELGHAMGLDHVAAGVMAPRVEDVAEVASAEDWREFCRANRCDSP